MTAAGRALASPSLRPVAAIALYLLWTLATWLLEGRPRTLLRPEAIGLRIAYTLIANLMIGVVGSLILLRWILRRDKSEPAVFGLASARRSLASVAAALALGAIAFALLAPWPGSWIALANVFAQVLPTSIAEVLVCWVLAGGAIATLIAGRWRWPVAGLASSLLFALYHLGHSPPFDQLAMMALLFVVGLGTSLVFALTRDLYGTLAWHNMMAVIGVTQALVAGGRTAAYTMPAPGLLLTGAAVLALAVALDRCWLRRR